MKKKLSVKALVDDVNAKLSDDEIMSKYGLSESGLKKAFDQLMRYLAACSSSGSIEVDD